MSKKNHFVWDDVEEGEAPTDKKSLYQETFENHKSKKEPKKVIDKPPLKKFKTNLNVKYMVLILIILLTIILFMPIIKIETVKINSLNFMTKKDVLTLYNVEEGSSVNLIEFVKMQVPMQVEGASDASISYNNDEKQLLIYIEEYVPIAIGANGDLYLKEADEISVIQEYNGKFVSLSNFSKQEEEILVENLAFLDYNILKEMVVIENLADEKNPELLIIEMKDGNYVKILISQIKTKLPYYNQISQIIKEKAGDNDGTIHLDRGDFYDPF